MALLTFTKLLLLISIGMSLTGGTQDFEDSRRHNFYYFSYGSNMLTKRIQMKNPSAARVGIGRLDHHRIDFTSHSDLWQGALATVVPTEGECVYGAIWKIDLKDKPHLNEQEGVSEGVYKVVMLNVVQDDGSKLRCKVYVHTDVPHYFEKIQEIPEFRRPSATYLDVIKAGAKESKLPADYVKYLFSIPDNGNTSSIMNILQPDRSVE